MAVVPALVCERCGSRDATVAWRRIETELSAPLCATCEQARSGINEAEGGLGWVLWVFVATIIGFALVVALVIVVSG
jgi:protein-arginine kinase activator protein McsA